MTHQCLALAITSIGAATCVFVTGCIPYAYPKLSYVPSAELVPEASDLHAFCVEAETNLALLELGRCDYKLTEITPRTNGTLPSQLRVTIESGIAHPTGGWYLFSGGRAHETLVRLYRPGYRLIEMHAWDSTDKIVWQPALDWRSQEQALLGLLAAPRLTPSPEPTGMRDLSLPTSNPSLQFEADRAWGRLLPLTPTTRQTKRVFDLAAAECERLAKCAPTAEDASQIRRLAARLIERKAEATKQKD